MVLSYLHYKAVQMLLIRCCFGYKYMVPAHLNNTLYRFIQDRWRVMYVCQLLQIECTNHKVNITTECLIKISISNICKECVKGHLIEDLLIKRASLKHSSFDNDKAPQRIYDQNKHYKNIIILGIQQTIHLRASI